MFQGEMLHWEKCCEEKYHGEMLQGKKSFGRNIAEPPRGSKRLLGTQIELQGTQIELLSAKGTMGFLADRK